MMLDIIFFVFGMLSYKFVSVVYGKLKIKVVAELQKLVPPAPPVV